LNEGRDKINEHGGYTVIVPEGSFLYHPAGLKNKQTRINKTNINIK